LKGKVTCFGGSRWKLKARELWGLIDGTKKKLDEKDEEALLN
jgi:hypothetical protein